MEGFGKLTGQRDPFLHFYETFLAAYNPAKRKARGVWYTPEPVVNFIVRAVDDVLQTEFNLADGLADTSKVTIDWETGQTDKKGRLQTIKKDVHRVQILDPATGTGTFLAEVVKQIAPRVHGIAPAMWSKYIEDDLIPRLHGFELLMASYAMCHMKLDMILTELGYKPAASPPRLSVYLTNSLEAGEPANQTLPFTQWLSREAKGANTIKRDMPIMCVIGNPPYLGEGGVSEGWIGNLLDDYKKEPGGKVKLQERNPKWLNDLYVKFIRLSSHLIEKNGEGVLGFITNHGYLDNPTFRGMRWHILNTFDRIWVLDLHGNTKKNEATPDGKVDKNVFDIQQGVSIIIAFKKEKKSALGEVMHGDLWGTRDKKYRELLTAKVSDPLFQRTKPREPFYTFSRVDYETFEEFDKGFSVKEIFLEGVLGFQTHRDQFALAESEAELLGRLERTNGGDFERRKLIEDFNLKENTSFSLDKLAAKFSGEAELKTESCLYRPFDKRITWMVRELIDRPRPLLQRNFQGKKNISLLVSRQLAKPGYAHVFISDCAAESCVVSLRTKEQNHVFPLYLYSDEQDLDQSRRVNFDPKLYKRLCSLAEHPKNGKPDETQVFDYIYGVLHCPAYRETYAEFLKADFPSIPWPSTPEEFWTVAEKGEYLRKLHLMEPSVIGDTPYPFMGEGENVVEKPRFEDGMVWINKSQYFANAPEISWNFWIGGYQPAQKWLKDRKGRTLSFDDAKHYQRILKILFKTDQIMHSIEMKLGNAASR